MSKVARIVAKEILSAGAFPTIQTRVELESGAIGVAEVPFGSSAGQYEAVTLVDKDPQRYGGLGMLTAVRNVAERIAPHIVGLDATNQESIDRSLRELDPSPLKENLGGNAILSVSLACARAASASYGVPLYRYLRDSIGGTYPILRMPKPMMVLMEGGRHADDSTDLQEYMISVEADLASRDAVRAGIEVYHALGRVLKQNGYSINVGLEGAFAPTGVKSNEEPLQHLVQAITNAGYRLGEDISISLDPAASEFFHNGRYTLSKEKLELSSEEMIEFYSRLAETYPVQSIEDGLSDDDWTGWSALTRRLGNRVAIIGDDLTVTSSDRLMRAIQQQAITGILIKPNQVGTLSETLEAIRIAQQHDLKVVVSHRGGGETTDTFIIDLAVATDAALVKVGPSRGERVAKYNRLMEISDELNL